MTKYWMLTVLILTVTSSAIAATELRFDPQLAKGQCQETWTKGGSLDREMFDHCMKQQAQGFEKANALYDRYSKIEPIDFIDNIVKFALSKWANTYDYQFDMVAYEIEQQADAYLDLQYGVSKGKIGAPRLSWCKSKWLSEREPMWDMVAYCAEN